MLYNSRLMGLNEIERFDKLNNVEMYFFVTLLHMFGAQIMIKDQFWSLIS